MRLYTAIMLVAAAANVIRCTNTTTMTSVSCL
jgi:hypothetical protein